jgi:hypothetical protein
MKFAFKIKMEPVMQAPSLLPPLSSPLAPSQQSLFTPAIQPSAPSARLPLPSSFI